MVERKICFSLDSGNNGKGREHRYLFQSPKSVGKSFNRQSKGLHAETAQSALIVISKLVIRGLISMILI